MARIDSLETATYPAGSLRELAGPFLRLGLTAFGGPAAHIALMEEEFVRRRQWISHEEFLDMLGASNLVPGPSSTEMAIHIGHQRAGWRGLLVSGACFILPAFAMTLALAWAYQRYGSLPQSQGLLYGIKPIIIAIIVQALWGLGRGAIKNSFLAIVAVAATLSALAGANVLAVLIAAGGLSIIQQRIRNRAAGHWQAVGIGAGPLAALAGAGATPVTILGLFLVFLKFGAVIFGSGYVLLAFLQADLVQRLHWMTQAQLLDAVAVGQFTPGPVFTTATFIGYLIRGPAGAVVATAGIFMPGFVFVALSRPLIPRVRRSQLAGAFLDGVNVGAVALMLAVTWQLGRAAIVDPLTAALAAIAAVALIYLRINSVWLIAAGAAIGLCAMLL